MCELILSRFPSVHLPPLTLGDGEAFRREPSFWKHPSVRILWMVRFAWDSVAIQGLCYLRVWDSLKGGLSFSFHPRSQRPMGKWALPIESVPVNRGEGVCIHATFVQYWARSLVACPIVGDCAKYWTRWLAGLACGRSLGNITHTVVWYDVQCTLW